MPCNGRADEIEILGSRLPAVSQVEPEVELVDEARDLRNPQLQSERKEPTEAMTSLMYTALMVGAVNWIFVATVGIESLSKMCSSVLLEETCHLSGNCSESLLTETCQTGSSSSFEGATLAVSRLMPTRDEFYKPVMIELGVCAVVAVISYVAGGWWVGPQVGPAPPWTIALYGSLLYSGWAWLGALLANIMPQTFAWPVGQDYAPYFTMKALQSSATCASDLITPDLVAWIFGRLDCAPKEIADYTSNIQFNDQTPPTTMYSFGIDHKLKYLGVEADNFTVAQRGVYALVSISTVWLTIKAWPCVSATINGAGAISGTAYTWPIKGSDALCTFGYR